VAIAAEVNSETAFVCWRRNRTSMIFACVSLRRIAKRPLSAIATIAAQYVLAKTRGAQKPKLRQLTGAGVIEVDVLKADGDFRIALTQSPPFARPHYSRSSPPTGTRRARHFQPEVCSKMHPQVMVKGSPRLLIALEFGGSADAN